jgi:hypothetical protein
METIWFQMLLGHLFGDYLLQNEWMALNKSKRTQEGFAAAVAHCWLYTLGVCLFMWNFSLVWISAVWFSHFFIDRYALGEKYMRYIKGSSLKQYIDTVNWTNSKCPPDDFTKGHQMLTGGFRAFVYAVTDNTMHLILMYLAYKLIY